MYGKNNVLTRFATNVVMQLVHNRFRMVNTLEEALDFLSNLHDNIPDYATWQQNQHVDQLTDAIADAPVDKAAQTDTSEPTE